MCSHSAAPVEAQYLCSRQDGQEERTILIYAGWQKYSRRYSSQVAKYRFLAPVCHTHSGNFNCPGVFLRVVDTHWRYLTAHSADGLMFHHCRHR